jgi:hypothetical protein
MPVVTIKAAEASQRERISNLLVLRIATWFPKETWAAGGWEQDVFTSLQY